MHMCGVRLTRTEEAERFGLVEDGLDIRVEDKEHEDVEAGGAEYSKLHARRAKRTLAKYTRSESQVRVQRETEREGVEVREAETRRGGCVDGRGRGAEAF